MALESSRLVVNTAENETPKVLWSVFLAKTTFARFLTRDCERERERERGFTARWRTE
jgi:hypothetical protein